MKKILIVLLIIIFPCIGLTQDKKITDLTEDTSPTRSDLVLTVDDPSGTPVNKKVTLENLLNGMLSGILLDNATGNEIAVNITYTTNKATSGDDSGLVVNQTDTASPGTSYLFRLQVGGVDKFYVKNDGTVSEARTAQPTVAFRDSDCTDDDDNAAIYADCSDTGSGTEDCDVFFAQQINGTKTIFFQADADGNLSFNDRILTPAKTGKHIVNSYSVPITTNPYTLTATNSYNSVIFYGATGEIDLPAAVQGMNLRIYNTGAFTITIDPNGSDVIVRNGTAQSAGVSMTLSSGAGNYVHLISDVANHWVTLDYIGTLAEGS